jgi:hypothetical protein
MIESYRSFQSGLLAKINLTFHLRDQCLMLCSRGLDIFVTFEVNKAFDRILLGKSRNESVSMFVDSSNKVACHSNVQDAVGSACQNVYVAAEHTRIVRDVDGRDKPGHDEVKGMD